MAIFSTAVGIKPQAFYTCNNLSNPKNFQQWAQLSTVPAGAL